jgi:hypothetical protein
MFSEDKEYFQKGKEVCLVLSDLARYHKLERKVYYYESGSVLYLILGTAKNALSIISEDKTLLARRPDRSRPVTLPISNSSFPKAISIDDLVKDSEVDYSVEYVKIFGVYLELSLSALRIYEEVIKRNTGKEKQFSVGDVFNFGMRVLSGLVLLSEQGYVIDRTIKNSEFSLKNPEEVYLTAKPFLDKIMDHKGWLAHSFYSP